MTVTDVGQLDAENRTTICQMILCDPYAGYLAREFLEAFPLYRGTPDGALLELIAWLILARETCGIGGVGHA